LDRVGGLSLHGVSRFGLNRVSRRNVTRLGVDRVSRRNVTRLGVDRRNGRNGWHQRLGWCFMGLRLGRHIGHGLGCGRIRLGRVVGGHHSVGRARGAARVLGGHLGSLGLLVSIHGPGKAIAEVAKSFIVIFICNGRRARWTKGEAGGHFAQVAESIGASARGSGSRDSADGEERQGDV
jgi:hypothetical protein